MTHLDELRAKYRITRRWQPQMGEDERARGVAAGEEASIGRSTGGEGAGRCWSAQG
jgi:hypothetical protein